jgi:hypothetical protein
MAQPNGTPAPDQDAIAAEWAAMVGLPAEKGEAQAAKPGGGPEDSLAASWADALRSDDLTGGATGSADAAAAGQAGRALNQDEIDNLFGVSAVALKKERSGIMSLVQSLFYRAAPSSVVRSDGGRRCGRWKIASGTRMMADAIRAT